MTMVILWQRLSKGRSGFSRDFLFVCELAEVCLIASLGCFEGRDLSLDAGVTVAL